MESQNKRDIHHLIKLIELATPDSLNIANAILNNNIKIDIPNLQTLRSALYCSLNDKGNRQLSQHVREIKKEIIANLTYKHS